MQSRDIASELTCLQDATIPPFQGPPPEARVVAPRRSKAQAGHSSPGWQRALAARLDMCVGGVLLPMAGLRRLSGRLSPWWAPAGHHLAFAALPRPRSWLSEAGARPEPPLSRFSGATHTPITLSCLARGPRAAPRLKAIYPADRSRRLPAPAPPSNDATRRPVARSGTLARAPPSSLPPTHHTFTLSNVPPAGARMITVAAEATSPAGPATAPHLPLPAHSRPGFSENSQASLRAPFRGLPRPPRSLPPIHLPHSQRRVPFDRRPHTSPVSVRP